MKNVLRPLFVALVMAGAAASIVHADGGTSLGWGVKNWRPSSGTAQTTRAPQVNVNIVGGVNPADTSGVPLQFNSDGSLVTKENTPVSGLHVSQTLVTNSSLALGAADSSIVFDTHICTHGMLMLYVHPAGGGTGLINRLAIQVRAHRNGGVDSLSTFALYDVGSFDNAASAQLDTTNGGHLFTGSASVPWSGEKVYTFNANRSSPGNAIGAIAFSYPKGVAIPMDWIFARFGHIEYMSVRIRNLVGPTCNVNAYFEGGAQ